MGPYLLGALVGKDTKNPLDAGFHVEHEFLESAKLDLSGTGQGVGAGGDWADLFSPDFMVHYLAYWTTRPDYETFLRGLPVLGKDGTLAKIQVNSPAAGHVLAKTGTFGSEDRLDGKLILNSNGLVAYVMTKDNKKLAFAVYLNHVTLPPDMEAAQTVAGGRDRKSTRLNSSHVAISYAVFCLKKKMKTLKFTTSRACQE